MIDVLFESYYIVAIPTVAVIVTYMIDRGLRRGR